MPDQQRAPLSEEDLNEIEIAIQGNYAGQIRLGHPVMGDLVRLVAEVRRLRYEALVAAEAKELHHSEFALAEAEIARLRKLLRSHGRHLGYCQQMIYGSRRQCTCNWVAVERELAGEGQEG